jgi:putative molybdopterin biosynthesis protein
MARTRYLNKKSLSEALRLFVEEFPVRRRPPEEIPVQESLARVTAEPIFAKTSVPHYHGAAMDGIAVRAEDTFGASDANPIELRLVQSADVARARTNRSTDRPPFSYIDTGQALPRWANAVIMIENVYSADAKRVCVRAAAAPWQHVRLVGEDIVATEPLLPRGHRIRPFDLGALLAAGHVVVRVMPRPTVAIVPTGSELIEPGEKLSPGAIVEFNSHVTAAFVSEWGGVAIRCPPVPDELEAIRDAIARSARDHDVVLVIAGSSAGEHDYTVQAVGALGEILVHGIEIMPGKPAICARVGDRPVLGVPGYPVSAIIVCQQLLKPLLAKLVGRGVDPPQLVRARVPRKIPSKLGLEEFVRVTLGRVGDQIVANPLGRGAGVITTMVRADGFLRIPSLSEGINAGEEAEVELLRPAAEIERTIVFSGSHDLSIGILEDSLKRRAPELKISTTNVGSLGGLTALKRGEAHLIGTHLLDPKTGTYNLPDTRRILGPRPDVVIMNLVVREQGLIVAKGNPKRIRTLKDLARKDVSFVNRQAGAGTRVLLDYLLGKLRIKPAQINGYEREEFTHMAVAVAVASGLADCALGVRAAAIALGLDFIPIEREEYDLVLRHDFADSSLGQLLIECVRSAEFRESVLKLGGYDVTKTGTLKPIAENRLSRQRGGSAKRGARAAAGRQR